MNDANNNEFIKKEEEGLKCDSEEVQCGKCEVNDEIGGKCEIANEKNDNAGNFAFPSSAPQSNSRRCSQYQTPNKNHSKNFHHNGTKFTENKCHNFIKSEWPPIITGICGMIVSCIFLFFENWSVLMIGACLMLISFVWAKILLRKS